MKLALCGLSRKRCCAHLRVYAGRLVGEATTGVTGGARGSARRGVAARVLGSHGGGEDVDVVVLCLNAVFGNVDGVVSGGNVGEEAGLLRQRSVKHCLLLVVRRCR